MRVRHHALQTPVVRFRHRLTGRTVTMVATVHVAESAYYDRLAALVAELEAAGAVVYSEGIGLAGEREWGTASTSERAARDEYFDELGGRFQAMGDYLGWVRQRFPLADVPSWRKVDMTDLEFTRRARLRDTGSRRTVQQLSARFSVPVRGIGALLAVLTQLEAADRFGVMVLLLDIAVHGRDVRRERDVMVGERNRLLLEALSADEDAVLVWGAGHLPGLARGLRSAGYRRQATEWLTAGTLPPMRKSFRVLWDTIGSLEEDDGDNLSRLRST